MCSTRADRQTDILAVSSTLPAPEVEVKSVFVQATWLEGHSLAQTVFINLYLHDPSVVKDRTLRTFCVCFLKLVDSIRDRINRASVFEEVRFFDEIS